MILKKTPTKKSAAQKLPRAQAAARRTKQTKRRIKHKRFAEEFVATGGNATRAAQAVGVVGDSAWSEGYKLVRKDEVQKYIQQVAAERGEDAKVRAVEVLGTLASHLRADLALVFEEDGRFDLQACRARGISHWIREIEVKERFIRAVGFINKAEEAEELVERRTRVKIHDAQAAARTLVKVFGLERAPRKNERDIIEDAITKYMDEKKITRAQAIVDLATDSPEVARMLGDLGEL